VTIPSTDTLCDKFDKQPTPVENSMFLRFNRSFLRHSFGPDDEECGLNTCRADLRQGQWISTARKTVAQKEAATDGLVKRMPDYVITAAIHA
jgi:hypothetical protein